MANKMAEKKRRANQSSSRSQTAKGTKTVSSGNQQAQLQETAFASTPAKPSVESTPAKKASTEARVERKEQPKRESRPAPQPARRETREPSLVTRFRNSRTGRFLFEAYYELRYKVTWPTFEEARNMTVAVLALSAVVGLILGGADYGLRHLVLWLTGAK